MAYDPNSQDDEDIRRQAQAPGATAPTGYASAGQSSPAQTAAPTSGPSNFVSFDRYFGANAGAANRTANNMAQTIGTQAQNAQDALTKAQSDFKTQVAAGGRGDAYKGPAYFGDGQDLTSVQGGLKSAVDNLGATKDYSGLQALLANQQNTNSSYNAGMNRFDAALTGMAGHQAFDDLRKKYAGLDSAFGNAYAEGNQEVAVARDPGPEAPSQQRRASPATLPDGETKQQARQETRAGGSSNQHVHHSRNPQNDFDGGGEYGDPISGSTPPPSQSYPDDGTDDTETQDQRRRDARNS